jgi:nucleoside-diphosphate-sugar epimerase
MQISITGATGFIGKRLVRYYQQQGAIVHLLSRNDVPVAGAGTRLFQRDLSISDSNDLIDFVDGSDVVYHCAAELSNVSRMREVNVAGTQKLFDAARGRVGRWVQLSSVGVYGQPGSGLVDESQAPDPHNEYEKSKLAADEWLREQSRQHGTALTILRPSTVFADDMPNQSLFQLIGAIQRGRFCFIGSKRSQMNYVHADNVLAALVLCGHHAEAAGETFIVSEHLDVGEFIGVVADQLHCARPGIIIPETVARAVAALASGIPRFPLTASRIDALTSQCIFVEDHIRHQLGYVPAITLEQGLRGLVDHYSTGCQIAQ